MLDTKPSVQYQLH